MNGQTKNIVLILIILGAIYLMWNNKDDLKNKLEDFEEKQKQAIRDELDKEKERRMRSETLAIEDDNQPMSRRKKRYKINMNVRKKILDKQTLKNNKKLRKYKIISRQNLKSKNKQISKQAFSKQAFSKQAFSKQAFSKQSCDDILNDIPIDIENDYCQDDKTLTQYEKQNTEQNIITYQKNDKKSDQTKEKADIMDGNITDGNVTDGNVTDGNVTDGNVTDGNVTDGNVRGQALVGMMHFLNGMKSNKKDKPIDMNDPKMQQLVQSDQFKELLARKNEIDFENDLKTALNMKISSKNKYFMDIHSDINFNGRVVIELFADIVPKTCRNFRKIITQLPPKKSYIGCPFHKYIKGFVMVGGDITKHDGSGGKSIYGPTFRDENFTLKHNQEGIVSMANDGKDSNNSQFFFVLRENGAPWLDNKHVVFGIIINGLDYLIELGNKIHIDGNDKPVDCVWIDDCGEVDIENGEECYDDISSLSTSALSAM